MIPIEFYYIFVTAVLIEHHLRMVRLNKDILVAGGEQCRYETLIQVCNRS
jgi:hypothetical protein